RFPPSRPRGAGNRPAHKPGEFLKQTFKVEFEAEDRDEAIARNEEWAALPPKERIRREDDQLRKVVKNWDDVTGADGKTPVSFSAEAFEQGLRHSWFRIGLYRAYAESLNGEAPRLGN